jgi:electron transfer flavoprotein beta subunit
MQIVVLVKYVPDATGPRRLTGPELRLDRETDPGLLCELDEYAVEQALVAAGAHGGTVTALTLGPAAAETAVRGALQMGADRAVHLLDDALAGSDAPGTSLALAAAVDRLGCDLLLTGMASTDGGTGAVPAMIAERLGLPHLALADHLEVHGGEALIHRDRDRDTEVLRAPLPAVVSVTDRIGDPRYPTFRAIVAARRKQITTWSLADLDVAADQVGAAGARTAVDAVEQVPARQTGRVVVDTGDGAEQLVDFLAEQGFVPTG